MKGKWILIACVTGLLITVFGTGNHPDFVWAQTKKGVLKIGVCGPLSGAGITYGYAALAGLELKNEEIQKAGGLKIGDTVYTVQPIPYDTKYLPDPSVTAVKRLVYEDKVKIIFGECGSAAAMAAQPITESNKIIYIINTYTNRTLSPQTIYTFRTGNTPMEFGPAMLAYYRQQFPNAKKIGYLYREDETGKSMLAMQQKNAPVQGFEVVPLPVEPGTMDLTPLVTKMISGNIDILDADGNPPGEVAQIVNIAKGMGWDKPIVRTGGSIVDELLRLCGTNANGFIYREDGDVSDPKVVELFNRFKARGYPTIPVSTMIPHYDMAGILFKALQIAGTVDDTAKIRDALESVKSYDGIQAKISWWGKEAYGISHQLLAPNFIGVIKEGKPSIVYRTDKSN